MKVFLDANVLISVLNKEYPTFSYSSRILSLPDYTPVKNYTSPTCIGITCYFSAKKSGAKVARNKIETLCRHINITKMDSNMIMEAVRNKKIHDLEDGFQYYSALEAGCKCIVTENTGDFYFSDIEVMNSRSYFEKYIKYARIK
jgi:predicted nucleic acid-binding protein